MEELRWDLFGAVIAGMAMAFLIVWANDLSRPVPLKVEINDDGRFRCDAAYLYPLVTIYTSEARDVTWVCTNSPQWEKGSK